MLRVCTNFFNFLFCCKLKNCQCALLNFRNRWMQHSAGSKDSLLDIVQIKHQKYVFIALGVVFSFSIQQYKILSLFSKPRGFCFWHASLMACINCHTMHRTSDLSRDNASEIVQPPKMEGLAANSAVVCTQQFSQAISHKTCARPAWTSHLSKLLTL